MIQIQFNHKYTVLLYLALLFSNAELQAQTTTLFSIKGQVTDQQQQPIEVGNLLILHPNDSSLIKGTYIMDGLFELEGLSMPKFLVQLTALGYSDTIFIVETTEKKDLIELGRFTLSTNNNLKTVTVEATVPTFKSERGKVIVNVEKSMLSNSGTALDVLHRSPRVIVNSKDEVTVFGKGSPILLLDGQPVSAQELKMIPSTEIKEVEIIKNPSARYDAAGRAVINIITIRQNLEGYNARALLSLTQRRFFSAFGNLNFNYRKKKWSLGISYGYNYRKSWYSNNYFREYPTSLIDTMRMYNNIASTNTTPQHHFYRFKIGYRPDSISIIGLQYRGSFGNYLSDIHNQNKVTLNHHDFNQIVANTKGNRKGLNNSVNLNYIRDLDTLDSELFIAGQYSNYTRNGLDQIDQTQQMPLDTQQNAYQNSNNSFINILNAQLDFTKGFKNKMLFQTGIKNAFILNNSDIRFLEQDKVGKWVADSSYSNGYNYNENILGVYSQVNWENEKWFMEAGIRAEWATMQGFSKVNGQQLLHRNYWHVFPTASLSYNILEDLATSINYTTSIQRPTFSDLNPFVDFIDQYSTERGNPYLLPAYTHSAEWALTYMEMASLEFEFARTFNHMDIFIDKQGNSFNIITQNYEKVDQINVTLNLPYENKWWTTYNSFGFSYTILQYDKGSDLLNYARPMFYIYSYNAFRIPKVFNLELTFQYVSGGAEGYFSFNPFYELGASIERKFLDDKLSIRLSVNDILYSYKESGVSLVNAFNVHYENRYDTRSIRLAISYNFGKLQSKGLKDRSVNRSETGRIK
ncbi:outer membrane beta-barrel family protein [Aureispira anguillae]|uniref:Outer membrane beta-barrel family protein n=1 Tax=Aureispira anguillae TaxID=2864201 RepID=A0A915YLT7_9BACT|nr:outer membrane beta-barrel family protein [Aureispira anguillae]BDS15123.1 outer membrane beta-barrel family protein [Aureispira anguillae]